MTPNSSKQKVVTYTEAVAMLNKYGNLDRIPHGWVQVDFRLSQLNAAG